MGSHLRQKDITGTLFSQSLYYNDKRTNNTNEARYNGNISGMDWSADSKNRGYDFSYDALSRLTEARYLEGGARSDKFDTSYSYDKHGNVLTLSRRGNGGTTTYNTVDNLIMNYMGNQLLKVDDAATNPTLSMSLDFKNGTSQEVEYSYDSNGNMVKDLNKGISKIEYNVLNLPKKITFTGVNNPTTTYAYSVGGDKLSVTHSSSTSKRTDYVGNKIYENGNLKRILVDGGYIENGVYHFFLQDHLGNNRIVAKADGTVVQTNHYYPYGMSFTESTQTSNQPYRYNGKELDTEYGLNLYDYEARYTDVALGRFTTPDRLSEKYYSMSSYGYCGNNPLRYIDPDGGDWYSYQDKDGKTNYAFNADIHSQKELDKVMEGAKYHGKTHDDGNTYYSLLGWQFESKSVESKIMGKMDDAIINYQAASSQKFDYYGNPLTSSEKETDFDIGLYASSSVMTSQKYTKFNIEGGYAVYYQVEKGVNNKAKFGSAGYLNEGKVVGMSNNGQGDLKDGVPLRFERTRTEGNKVRHAADMVFTNLATAKKINQLYDRLFKK